MDLHLAQCHVSDCYHFSQFLFEILGLQGKSSLWIQHKNANLYSSCDKTYLAGSLPQWSSSDEKIVFKKVLSFVPQHIWYCAYCSRNQEETTKKPKRDFSSHTNAMFILANSNWKKKLGSNTEHWYQSWDTDKNLLVWQNINTGCLVLDKWLMLSPLPVPKKRGVLANSKGPTGTLGSDWNKNHVLTLSFWSPLVITAACVPKCLTQGCRFLSESWTVCCLLLVREEFVNGQACNQITTITIQDPLVTAMLSTVCLL